MDNLNVKKADGRIEPWSNDKIVAAIGRAGVPVEAAQSTAKAVTAWARGAAEKGVIASTLIRDKVIELLKKEFPAQSDSFSAYKKY